MRAVLRHTGLDTFGPPRLRNSKTTGQNAIYVANNLLCKSLFGLRRGGGAEASPVGLRFGSGPGLGPWPGFSLLEHVYGLRSIQPMPVRIGHGLVRTLVRAQPLADQV